ncbi:MAG: RIP metalloprotease RseP [Aestuariivita sp.]|nr:RIP metalloprotease RseP [Aestuariivita sp.]
MTLVAFIVALSIIVAVHEFGHYIIARWSGIHADIFSIGFGPKLISWIDRRGTCWQVAIIPLGGYVKFAGDSDFFSSRGTENLSELEKTELRKTLHGAPLWARTITVAAGPIFNFVMSTIVFAFFYMSDGEVKMPLTVGAINNLPNGSYDLRAGDQIVGFSDGQDFLSIDDDPSILRFDQLPNVEIMKYQVVRNGQSMIIEGPNLFPSYVETVVPLSAADDIGIRPGDVIVAVNKEPIFSFSQLRDIVTSSTGRSLQLEIWRDGKVTEVMISPKRNDEPSSEGGFSPEWRLGIVGGMAFAPEAVSIGPGESIWKGLQTTGMIIEGSLSGLFHIISGAISACNLSGIIGIAEATGSMAEQGLGSYLWFIAVLSAAIGLVNLFPIPVLDGGHLIFFAYEGITGRKPNEKIFGLLTTMGLIFVVGVMIIAILTDIVCP